MKLSVVAFLIFSLTLSSYIVQSTAAVPINCGSKCALRCSKAGQAKRCLIYCGICCKKCNCVPSGTYGNKSECACYRDMKNSKGTSKCP